jgi:hypothetical protein
LASLSSISSLIPIHIPLVSTQSTNSEAARYVLFQMNLDA